MNKWIRNLVQFKSAKTVSRIFLILLVLSMGIQAQSKSFQSSCINTYLGMGKFGEHFFLDSAHGINNSPIKKLKVFIQNFENLGIFEEKFREKILINNVLKEVTKVKTIEKSEDQKLRLALRIKKQNPDIIVATEIKDIETAQNYSREYLNDEYQAILIEGNDTRGIDICFFVRRTLNIDLEVRSHRKYGQSDTQPNPVFSRDLPVLLVRQAGASKLSTPLMAIMGTHLKSRLGDTTGNDKSLAKRSAQVLASIEIMNSLEKEFQGLPVLMAGDFNNDVQKAKEFFPLFQDSQMKDSMNVAKDSPQPADRGTQYFFTEVDPTIPGWELILSQLDAMLVNSRLAAAIISSGIQRDIMPNGQETPMPKESNDVNLRGSDHDGIFTLFGF